MADDQENEESPSRREASPYRMFESAKALSRLRDELREMARLGLRVRKTLPQGSSHIRDVGDGILIIEVSEMLLDEVFPLYFEGKWVPADELEPITVEDAAAELGLASSQALYQRIYRADKRGDPHPFRKPEGSTQYVAYRADVIAWGKTLTGKKRVRERKARDL